jgi:acyl dehydratase
MAVTIAHRDGSALLGGVKGMPEFNPMMVLHGEERVEIISPIENDTTLVVTEFVHDMQDKGKATVMTMRNEIRVKGTNELKTIVYNTAFIRGIGGFGRKGFFKNELPNAPKRPANAVLSMKTDPGQAFLYRLNGDTNPLHVDPDMSAIGGFETPILHGLCTYGITARAVYEQYFKGNANALKAVNGRFTSHVYPGETLEVHMWKDGNKIIVNTKTKERGLVVLKAYYELKDEAKM